MKTLARHRKLLGLTQHQLASLAGIRVYRLSWAETGRIRLTADERNRLREKLSQRAVQVVKAVA